MRFAKSNSSNKVARTRATKDRDAERDAHPTSEGPWRAGKIASGATYDSGATYLQHKCGQAAKLHVGVGELDP